LNHCLKVHSADTSQKPEPKLHGQKLFIDWGIFFVISKIIFKVYENFKKPHNPKLMFLFYQKQIYLQLYSYKKIIDFNF